MPLGTCGSYAFVLTELADDIAHLRKLAAECRSVASGLSDATDIAALMRMATEYETLARRAETNPMPGPGNRVCM